MNWPARPVTVRVPATSANLGPGFDALGLALGLHDVVQARIIADGVAIKVSGVGEDTAAADDAHLVIQAMRAAFSLLGAQPIDPDHPQGQSPRHHNLAAAPSPPSQPAAIDRSLRRKQARLGGRIFFLPGAPAFGYRWRRMPVWRNW